MPVLVGEVCFLTNRSKSGTGTDDVCLGRVGACPSLGRRDRDYAVRCREGQTLSEVTKWARHGCYAGTIMPVLDGSTGTLDQGGPDGNARTGRWTTISK